MQEVFRLTRKAAQSSASVLVAGRNGHREGAGGGALHRLSRRSNGPLVKVNCGALSESLLESELFGHVRGAFTGAVANRTGRFEAAHTGTIFLDEIDSTSRNAAGEAAACPAGDGNLSGWGTRRRSARMSA